MTRECGDPSGQKNPHPEEEVQPGEVAFTPLVRGMEMTRSCKLKFVTDDLAVVGPTTNLFLTAVLVLAMGGAAAYLCFRGLAEGVALWTMIVPGLATPLFLIGGMVMLLKTRRFTFDRIQRRCWVGNREYDARGEDIRIPLDDIVALQILGEGINSRYTRRNYELNLILRHPRGRRVNVMKSTGAEDLFQETSQLARFLDKPVWAQKNL